MNPSPPVTPMFWFACSVAKILNGKSRSKRTRTAGRQGTLAVLSHMAACLLFSWSAWAQAPARILQADERYKVDILLVVAHPDDEGAATPYLARALDEGKRVAVIYGTRGSSGANEAGAEKATPPGEIRANAARPAEAALRIGNNWCFGGKVTTPPDALQSTST